MCEHIRQSKELIERRDIGIWHQHSPPRVTIPGQITQRDKWRISRARRSCDNGRFALWVQVGWRA